MEDFTMFHSQANHCQVSNLNCSKTMDTRCSKISSLFPARKADSPICAQFQSPAATQSVSVKTEKSANSKSGPEPPKAKKIGKKGARKSARKSQQDKFCIPNQGTLDTFFAARNAKTESELQKINLAPKRRVTQYQLKITKVSGFIVKRRDKKAEAESKHKVAGQGVGTDLVKTANCQSQRLGGQVQSPPRNKKSAESAKTGQPVHSKAPQTQGHTSLLSDTAMRVETPLKIPSHPNPFLFNVLPVDQQKLRNIEISEQKRIFTQEISDLSRELSHKFKISRPIGKGSFAVVYSAVDLETSQKVAIKIYKNNCPKIERQTEIIENEIRVLASLKDEKIVRFLEVVRTSSYTVVSLELIQGLTLSTFLSKFPNKRLPESMALQIFKQVVDCISVCHSAKVFHRDIKLSNVMIKKTLDIVLIDFGFAMMSPKKELVSTYCGTLNYISPELLRNRPYRPGPVDVWALGIFLFKLLTGEYPFNGELISP